MATGSIPTRSGTRALAPIAFLALLQCASAGPGSARAATTNARVATNEAKAVNPKTSTPARAAPSAVAMYECETVHTYPHDRAAFTQGLVFLEGYLLESTGLKGRSSLRKVELESGRVLQQLRLSEEYFAEGLAVFSGSIFQLTWQNGKCFIYDLPTFHKTKELAYQGEGWGLTSDGQSLILSDGTEHLRFLDPTSLTAVRTITVTVAGRPLNRLNELEYVKAEIFANVWGTDFIARIDPATGKVVGLIDCTGLLPLSERDATTDVLNGIAYDPRAGRLFVTGKHWPKLFEIKLKPKTGGRH